jgi:histidinol phosphatase-like enzyme
MCKNNCKVVFLDRDGTMNVEVNYLHRKEDLKLIDGTAEAVRLLNRHYQPGGRGEGLLYRGGCKNPS